MRIILKLWKLWKHARIKKYIMSLPSNWSWEQRCLGSIVDPESECLGFRTGNWHRWLCIWHSIRQAILLISSHSILVWLFTSCVCQAYYLTIFNPKLPICKNSTKLIEFLWGLKIIGILLKVSGKVNAVWMFTISTFTDEETEVWGG